MNLNVVENWQINPEAEAEDLEAKQPFIDNGLDVVDPSRYYSREFMKREWETMWTRTWLIAGIETDIPEPGNYTVFRPGRESIITTTGAA
jgi:hypothetical protein